MGRGPEPRRLAVLAPAVAAAVALTACDSVFGRWDRVRVQIEPPPAAAVTGDEDGGEGGAAEGGAAEGEAEGGGAGGDPGGGAGAGAGGGSAAGGGTTGATSGGTTTGGTTDGTPADTTPPTVDAGTARVERATFTQTGTASDDSGGALTLQWTKVSGPGTVTFGTPAAAATTVTASQDGAYVIALTATDAAGNDATASFTLTWDATPPPVPGGRRFAADLPTGPAATTDDPDGAVYLVWNPSVDAGVGLRDYAFIWYEDGNCGVDGGTAHPGTVTGTSAAATGVFADGDLISFHVAAVDQLGNASADSLCTGPLTIDGVGPDPLTAFSGATGQSLGVVTLTLGFPGTRGEYGRVDIRRAAGSTPSCAAPATGTVALSLTPPFSVASATLSDDTGKAGTTFTYVACVYDEVGNLTDTNAPFNATSKPHVLFVASGAGWTGNLGSAATTGALKGDAICAAKAAAVPPPPDPNGNYYDAVHHEPHWRAILSDTAYDAIDRVRVTGRTADITGVDIATTRAMLWSGSLLFGPFFDELGQQGALVWTGSDSSGLRTAATCSNWNATTNAASGTTGDPNLDDDGWLQLTDAACDQLRSVYCISQYDYPALTFTAATAPAGSGRIRLVVTPPADVSKYSYVLIARRSDGIVPGPSCGDGTLVTGSPFTNLSAPIQFDDMGLTPNAFYEYRACAFDADNNLLSDSPQPSIRASN